MQTKKTHHVVPNIDGTWTIRKGGSWKSFGLFARKQDAIERARQISREEKSELVIHHDDGRITHPDTGIAKQPSLFGDSGV